MRLLCVMLKQFMFSLTLIPNGSICMSHVSKVRKPSFHPEVTHYSGVKAFLSLSWQTKTHARSRELEQNYLREIKCQAGTVAQ